MKKRPRNNKYGKPDERLLPVRSLTQRTDRQTDRLTDGQMTDGQTDRQTDGHG